jgi:hypothetical protein
MVEVGQSIAPQSISNATVSGNAIVEPQNRCTQIAFILQGGALAATVDGSFTFQGRLRSDGTTWQTLKDKDNNNLILAGADWDDAGKLENGSFVGTLRVDAVDFTTYEAVRVQFTEGATAAALIAVSHILFGFMEKPSGQTDELFALQVGL